MARITQALLLSPDRASVVLTHAQVERSLFEPLAFSESYPEAPKLTASIYGAPRASWQLGRVLRLEYDTGQAEAWRVTRTAQSYTSAESWTVDLAPLWLDLASRTLVAEIEGTSVATPRLSLVSRSPASCLGVAFDPLSGAPAIGSGAPMFIVGSVDARYDHDRVDVSIVGGSPLDVLEAVASELRCLWRARLVLSGDGPADEVYEVDLYAPSEPPSVRAQAFETATEGKVSLATMAEVGNAPGMVRPNAAQLDVEDDVSGLVTAIVPLAASQGEDAVGVQDHLFVATGVSTDADGNAVVTLHQPYYATATGAVVPYDGALDGLVACLVDDSDVPERPFVVLSSAAPDVVTLQPSDPAPPGYFGYYRFKRPGTGGGPLRALVELVNGPAAARYGLLSEARTYDDVAPYDNLFENGACDLETDPGPGFLPTPLGFSVITGTFDDVPFEWVDAEASVSVGARSAQFTSAAGNGVEVSARPLAYAGTSRARAAWVSMRVVSGRVSVTMTDAAGGAVPGMSPGSIVVEAPDGVVSVLTTVELVAADIDDLGATVISFTALDAATVWVVDALTVVQSTAVQPYRTLMGPNALWTRAWDDLLLAPRRVTTASTTMFDPAALGLAGADLGPGAWVRVRPDGRAAFDAQVLEARWALGVGPEGVPGEIAAERQMRLGPPPVDLVARLSRPPDRARAPEGSKRAPVYGMLYDRGVTTSGNGRTIEPSTDGLIDEVTAERTFLGVTYSLTAYRPTAAAASLVRRHTSRPDERALHLIQPPA